MKRWFGFTQGGCVVYLGDGETIDDVDNDETGGSTCMWIWSEESLRQMQTEIEELLKMQTYKIPVTFYIKARNSENAEATLLGALGYLEDNCGLRAYAQVEYNMDEKNPETVDFDWKNLEEVV